ncbi:MAG: hypothetical protein N3A65_01180 [candidate division WOR-3 bacterium]|nr:hypothetical protein [candidate division WOR-3 bacterium]
MCACEPSGDLYAALFVKDQLTKYRKIYGVGGDNLKSTKVKIIHEYKNLKTLGFTAGIGTFMKNFLMYRKIARSIFKIKPAFFIAVAYPGVNLLLCRYAKKLGIKTIYLLPPQIWAWGSFRKYFIKKWVDLNISVFPFEYQFYKSLNLKVIYWQNPLFGLLKGYRRQIISNQIGVMPGSRIPDLKRNLKIINGIIKELPDFNFTFILHPEIQFNQFEKLVLKESLNKIKIVSLDRYQEMCKCRVIITCSGTASFETALLRIPQVFFYYPDFLDYHIFRHFLKINEYNLVNLYYGQKLIPVFVSRNKKKLIQKVAGELYRLLKPGNKNC